MGNSTLQTGASFFNIDISHLAAGVYRLNMLKGNQTATASFVISNGKAK